MFKRRIILQIFVCIMIWIRKKWENEDFSIKVLQGVLAAVPLAFILPPLCYLKLQSKPWLSWSQAPSLAMAAFGILVAVCGLGLLIQQVCVEPYIIFLWRRLFRVFPAAAMELTLATLSTAPLRITSQFWNSVCLN